MLTTSISFSVFIACGTPFLQTDCEVRTVSQAHRCTTSETLNFRFNEIRKYISSASCTSRCIGGWSISSFDCSDSMSFSFLRTFTFVHHSCSVKSNSNEKKMKRKDQTAGYLSNGSLFDSHFSICNSPNGHRFVFTIFRLPQNFFVAISIHFDCNASAVGDENETISVPLASVL